MIKLKSLFRRGPSGPSSSKQAAAAAAAAASGGNSTAGGNAPATNNVNTAAGGGPAQQLKGASSVSSLDHRSADTKSSKSSHKHHGSKDRLFDTARVSKSASRDKLAASRESLDLKESTTSLKQRQQQQQQPQPHQSQQHSNRQMPLVQQQPQQLQQASQHLAGNNNLLDVGGGNSGAGAYATMVVDPTLTKELTDITFDGPREVSLCLDRF